MKAIIRPLFLILITAASSAFAFEAGEGVVDISPPVGTALGGFHYGVVELPPAGTPAAPGAQPSPPAPAGAADAPKAYKTVPRLSTGISTVPEVRALVLKRGEAVAAIISFDMLNVSFGMVQRVQAAVEKKCGIPASHVHISASHSHSMPSIAFNRHWGDNNPAYEATVEAAMLQAVEKAKSDLAPATLRVGSAAVVGGNHNRTLRSGEKQRTDDEFNADSTDADRWLDTKLRLLAIERKDRPALLWYNFSAHCTAVRGALAGADWPGLVQKLVREERKLSPAFLQGHIGDVEPMKADDTARAVADAIYKALETAQPVAVDTLCVETQSFGLSLDIETFKKQVAQKTPFPGGKPPDVTYAQDWYDTFASHYDLTRTTLPIILSAIRLGDVALLFHPAELYSYYGLAMQRGSPFKNTFVIGYADGYVGYLPDPKAYERGEYAASTVPTILNYPPFTPNAAREMAAAAIDLLKKLDK